MTSKRKSKMSSTETAETLESAAPARRSAATRRSAAAAQPAPSEPIVVAPAASKKTAIEAMVRRPGGATLAELIVVTGWQKHSIRSALTMLRKTGATINCDRTDATARYSVPPPAGVERPADVEQNRASRQPKKLPGKAPARRPQVRRRATA